MFGHLGSGLLALLGGAALFATVIMLVWGIQYVFDRILNREVRR